MTECPLCLSTAPAWGEAHHGTYFDCPNCQLVFLNPPQRLSSDEERKRYDLHQNSPSDSKYRDFLAALSRPLIQHRGPGELGLDFGCGPGPTLSLMLEEAGMKMEIYDPFYFPDREVLKKKYHFISCTEVFEHLYQPNHVLAQLCKMLKDGGTLAVMTQILDTHDFKQFAQWHYARDDTHVCFYRSATLKWISRKYQLNLKKVSKNVTFFNKAFLASS